MAEEIEVYNKAFDCARRNSTIDKAVLDTIIQLENRYPLRGDPHHDNQVLKILFNEEFFQTELKTAIDEKSKQEKAFEKLKKAVTGNKKIIKQIEGLKRNKGIAIIGNNYDLISGIASYLWLTSPLIYKGIPPIWLMMSPIKQKFFDAIGKYINGKKGFCYINCDGVNETELHKELFKDIVTPPGLPYWVLFLRNINNSHDNIVKRMLGIMRDVGGQGNFIISTDLLPANLKGQFEPIYLEPEKQDIPEPKTQSTPVSTPKDTSEKQGISESRLKVSFNETDFIVTINGMEYVFEDNERKLFKEYKLFELLYKNQHLYKKKYEIKKELGLGDNADQQVFNIKANVKRIIRNSPYEIENQKEYDDRGGYKLTLK